MCVCPILSVDVCLELCSNLKVFWASADVEQGCNGQSPISRSTCTLLLQHDFSTCLKADVT